METKKKYPNYHRRLPVSENANRGERLAPVIECLKTEGVTVAELAQRCGITRQGMNKRLLVDDCSISDMETIAKALGYSFYWELVKNDDTDGVE